jgi:Uma2 family endonuclease
MALAENLNISIEDYLQGELSSDTKHEYINGEIYAMVGVKRAHDTINTNLIAYLHAHLRGTPCRVHSGEMKVRVKTASDDCFFYPDLHVTCEVTDNEEHFNSHPKLIIEVLSESTERFDRAEKFHFYRKLESLEEYVLVAQDMQRIECYRRSTHWDLELYREGERFNLQSVNLDLTVAEVYEGIEY